MLFSRNANCNRTKIISRTYFNCPHYRWSIGNLEVQLIEESFLILRLAEVSPFGSKSNHGKTYNSHVTDFFRCWTLYKFQEKLASLWDNFLSLQLNYFVFLKSQFIRIESRMTFFYSHFGKDETVKRTFYDLDQFCIIEYSVWRLVVFGSFFLRHLRIQCNRCVKCN